MSGWGSPGPRLELAPHPCLQREACVISLRACLKRLRTHVGGVDLSVRIAGWCFVFHRIMMVKASSARAVGVY